MLVARVVVLDYVGARNVYQEKLDEVLLVVEEAVAGAELNPSIFAWLIKPFPLSELFSYRSLTHSLGSHDNDSHHEEVFRRWWHYIISQWISSFRAYLYPLYFVFQVE